LQKFGFGESFINWINILYNAPSAKVTTNGITLESFTLHRGTRKGCPLSPSLFVIFIEPLAAAIHQILNITGIHTSLKHHKISLYADYILLFKKIKQRSLQEVVKLINSYSTIAEYSINWNN